MLTGADGEQAGSPFPCPQPNSSPRTHWSESYSLNPRTQRAFPSKDHLFASGLHPELYQHLLDTQLPRAGLSKFQACQNEKGHKSEVERCGDYEKYKDSKRGNRKLDVKGERKAEKYRPAVGMAGSPVTESLRKTV